MSINFYYIYGKLITLSGFVATLAPNWFDYHLWSGPWKKLKHNNKKSPIKMTTSSSVRFKLMGNKQAATQRPSGSERKTRGVLGASRLKAHVSTQRFCSISALLTRHYNKKNQIRRLTGGLSSIVSSLL